MKILKLTILSAMLSGALSISAFAQAPAEAQDPGTPPTGATRPLPANPPAQSATSAADDDSAGQPGQLPGAQPTHRTDGLSANPPSQSADTPLADPAPSGVDQQLSQPRNRIRCYDGSREVPC